MRCEWQWHTFDDLTGRQVYDVLKLRQEVFVVEQRCVFADIDGIDEQCWHLLGAGLDVRHLQGVGHLGLLAYLRLLPPGVSHHPPADGPAIGRVVTHAGARGHGIGRALMLEGMRKAGELYPGLPLRVMAQVYLRHFYESLGFRAASQPYDDDGIPHIDMVLDANQRG